MIVSGAACNGTDTVAPKATVYFVLDAPFCGTKLPVQFFVDATVVATDTFVVGLNPPHTKSAAIAVSPGSHALGARVVGGLVWPDTVVNVGSAGTVTRTLPFYCS